MVKPILLGLALFLSATCCRAQQIAPQMRIVDVMPTVDPGTIPQTPLLSLDFLIGAWPRPVWWGRQWRSNNSMEAHLPELRDFAGQLTAVSAKGTDSLGYLYCASYAPRWNEALGLYTVHVRVAFKSKVWPQNAKLHFVGELPAPFEAAKTGSGLPFDVEWEPLPKKGFPDAQLVSPRPTLWIKWVHVFHLPAAKDQHYSYEADVMLAGRRAKKRESTVDGGLFLDASGQEVHPQQAAGWGHLGGFGDPDSNMGDFEFADSRLEFAMWRLGWDEGIASASPDEFARQRIEYGGREPIVLTIPVKREGVTLEGEIPARDWKIESPAPPSN